MSHHANGFHHDLTFLFFAEDMSVTFVTGNKNKLAEVQAILADVLPNLKSQNLDRKFRRRVSCEWHD